MGARYIQGQIKKREVLDLTTPPDFKLKTFLSASLSQSAQKSRKSHCGCGDFFGSRPKKQALSHQWQTKTKTLTCDRYKLSESIPPHLNTSLHQIFASIFYICRHVGKKKVNLAAWRRSAEFQKLYEVNEVKVTC